LLPPLRAHMKSTQRMSGLGCLAAWLGERGRRFAHVSSTWRDGIGRPSLKPPPHAERNGVAGSRLLLPVLPRLQSNEKFSPLGEPPGVFPLLSSRLLEDGD
jgi:hypothetical protein